MNVANPPASSPADAEKQLASFIEKFDPDDRQRIRSVRAAMRKRFPTANELVWDNYNFFVIGYSPTERPSDSVLSIAARANGIGLCFMHGAELPDPEKVLLGSGKQTRFIRLGSASVLERPEVEMLLSAAVARAKVPFAATDGGKLVIRSVSKKQRPRRRPQKQVFAFAQRQLTWVMAMVARLGAAGIAVEETKSYPNASSALLHDPGRPSDRTVWPKGIEVNGSSNHPTRRSEGFPKLSIDLG